MTSDYATPCWKLALARMIDREAYNLKSGAAGDCKIAAQLRDIADALERRDGAERV